MRTFGHRRNRSFSRDWRALPITVLLVGLSSNYVGAQATSQEDLTQQVQRLTEAMARTQAQVQESQRQLEEMRKQLDELKRQIAQGASPQPPSSSEAAKDSHPAPKTAAAIEEIRERQALQEAQIAVHDQTKVESESRYPVKVTGLVLLNGFVNTSAVDQPATPTLAVPGAGSTGASVRQTIIGLDAQGPHLFGASSYANVRVDFSGRPGATGFMAGYSGYFGANSMLLRLRTARAALQWSRTEAFFLLNRPIFSPDMPDSLTAVAEPPLAWSGNLWTWNPQLGVTQDFVSSGSRGLRLEAALMDVGDAPLSPIVNVPAGTVPPSGAEQSRWPGVEARVALLGQGRDFERNHFGVGGYFAPHRSLGRRFDSWAGTLDAKVLLPARLQFAGSFYRGLALGGLGGGAFKDFAYRFDKDTGGYYFRPLDDMGGWAQLKEKLNERLEFNAAFGADNVFASELRPYFNPNSSTAQNLARNRTYTGNIIFSPSAYLLFSLEYRHLESSPVIGPSAVSNIVGLAAGYKF